MKRIKRAKDPCPPFTKEEMDELCRAVRDIIKAMTDSVHVPLEPNDAVGRI